MLINHLISVFILFFAVFQFFQIFCIAVPFLLMIPFGGFSQVHDSCNNCPVNFFEICVLCKWYAYGRAMGEKSCLHILLGTYSRLAPLIHVSMLLPRDFYVSIAFYCAVYSSRFLCFRKLFSAHDWIFSPAIPMPFPYMILLEEIMKYYCTSLLTLLHHIFIHFFVSWFYRNYGIPLHLIHELYETFRNFKIRIADYIRYRKITSNMNDSFPDATSNELNAWVACSNKPI